MNQSRTVRLRINLTRLRQKHIRHKTSIQNKKNEFKVLRGMAAIYSGTTAETMDYEIVLDVGRKRLEKQAMKLENKIYFVQLDMKVMNEKRRKFEQRLHLKQSTPSNSRVHVPESIHSELISNDQE